MIKRGPPAFCSVLFLKPTSSVIYDQYPHLLPNPIKAETLFIRNYNTRINQTVSDIRS